MDNAREETNPLNKYRTELMGASIILIMIFHNYDIIFPLKDIGQVGVDIFLFLSGTGCFYSFKKIKA